MKRWQRRFIYWTAYGVGFLILSTVANKYFGIDASMWFLFGVLFGIISVELRK